MFTTMLIAIWNFFFGKSKRADKANQTAAQTLKIELLSQLKETGQAGVYVSPSNSVFAKEAIKEIVRSYDVVCLHGPVIVAAAGVIEGMVTYPGGECYSVNIYDRAKREATLAFIVQALNSTSPENLSVAGKIVSLDSDRIAVELTEGVAKGHRGTVAKSELPKSLVHMFKLSAEVEVDILHGTQIVDHQLSIPLALFAPIARNCSLSRRCQV